MGPRQAPSISTAFPGGDVPSSKAGQCSVASRRGVSDTAHSQLCSGPGSWDGALRGTQALHGENDQNDLQRCCPVSCWVTADHADRNGQIFGASTGGR